MYKLPADLNGNFIPVTTIDPTTGESTPIKFYHPPDNTTGRYTGQSFRIGLNDALIECSKLQDQCYAVVIPDNDQGRYTYHLAQKPPSNNKSPDSDNEFFLCNQGYVSYIKDKTQSGRSNLMTSTVSCDFDSNRPISYGSTGITPDEKKSGAPKVFKYKDAKESPVVEQPPYLSYFCTFVVILLVAGGIYYYRTQMVDDTPVVSTISTSKLIKRKGGYFFFV
jgi:hypothetical protein